MRALIEHWASMIQKELGSFADPQRAKELMFILEEKDKLRYFEIADSGVFAYMIADDMKGNLCLTEIMFYIKPERRGSIKLVKKYIDTAEKIALANGCKCVKIGANIGYKDQSLIKLLRRWGYQDDTVSKDIGG